MYIAIVESLSNRITKYQAFELESDANSHVVIYGGYVYNNTNRMAIQDMWVNGETVTEVNSISLDEYKATAISKNQAEAGRRIAEFFGEVADGFSQGSDKVQFRQINFLAEGVALTLKVALATNTSEDDKRIAELGLIRDNINLNRALENDAATLINAVSTGDLAADKRTIDNLFVV